MYLAISLLSYSTTYTVWVNATDPTGSSEWTRTWYSFSTRRSGNNPPIFTREPSPSNSSIDRKLNLSWSIRINDIEGNNFSWTIQCSNGQSSNSTGEERNGTKRLELSGLSYFTTYTVWVNTTDSTGSGLWARKWYIFTTKANEPPMFGSPSPPSASVGNSLNFEWNIPIEEPDGTVFSWSIQCSNGQQASATNAANGTKTILLTGLAHSTTYKVWVNATDPTPQGSGFYTRSLFTFKTQGPSGNSPPVFTAPSPTNGSSGRRLNFEWNIQISDPEGTVFYWSIQCSNGQETNGSDAANGTKTLMISGLAYSTTYKIWVNATDPTGSNLYTRRWYIFTTEPIIPFNIPTTPKWSIVSNAGENRVAPYVADVNNDGQMEIIRSGQNGIVVYNGATGGVVWQRLVSMSNNHYPLEIIDLNKDGILEIVCSYGTGVRALYGNNGSVYWYNPNAPLYDKHLVVGDINGDGYPEVFVCMSGNQNGTHQGKITALTHNGQIFAQVSTYYPCYGGLTLGDTNNDGIYELFLCERNVGYHGNTVGKGVRALWASNLTERWSHPEMLSSSHCPTLVDTNKDGILDVVALHQRGGIAVFNSDDGTPIHQTNRIPGLSTHSQPTIYDIDNDGNLEIIVGGGSDSWSKPLIWDLYTWSADAWLPYDCWEPPAVVDLNGDGRLEILECTIDNISVFDDNYVFRGSIPLDNNNGENGFYGMSMIVAQDIDNDNLLELVLNRFNRIYTYDIESAAPTPRALTQFTYYSPLRGRSPYFTDY